MLGKIWKKVLFFILIIACIFNIITKLVNKSNGHTSLKIRLHPFNPFSSYKNKCVKFLIFIFFSCKCSIVIISKLIFNF